MAYMTLYETANYFNVDPRTIKRWHSIKPFLVYKNTFNDAILYEVSAYDWRLIYRKKYVQMAERKRRITYIPRKKAEIIRRKSDSEVNNRSCVRKNTNIWDIAWG